jgi:flavorubredoxin
VTFSTSTNGYYSYVAGGMKMFMDDHYIADVRKGMQGLKGKPYALFCSHGGGGRVTEAMRGLFKRVGSQVGETVSSRGYPTAQVLARCKSLGRALAEAAMR